MTKFGDWFYGRNLQGPVTEQRSLITYETAVSAPAYTSTAKPVTLDTALSMSAVYRSVEILTTWVSQMDLEVKRAGEVIPAPTFIRQPDVNTSAYQFVKQTVVSLALDGNAFWLVSRNAAGVVNNLEVLNPFTISVEQTGTGALVYKQTTADGQRTLQPRQVKHLQTMQVPGRLRGLSPIEANNAGLGAALSLRAYADNWFNESRSVRQHISADVYMDKDQLNEYAAAIKAQKAANNGDLITGMGTKVNNMTLNPQEAMWLEQQTFTVTEIARWFGIPPYLLLASVDGNSMTYSNLQTDAKLFVTNTLMGYMMPIQEAFTSLLPNGQVVKMKTEALLQADTQDRYEAYKTAIEAGFMTPNEVRALEGWKPLDVPATQATAPPVEENQTKEVSPQETPEAA